MTMSAPITKPFQLIRYTLKEHHIQMFKDAWKADFEEELSNTEARIQIDKLIQFYALVSRPLNSQDGKTSVLASERSQ
jgi:hypothetical protein